MNMANSFGWTQVAIASRNGNVENVKHLVDSGESLSIANPYGYTPLSLSIFSKCKETFTYIFQEMLLTSIQDLKEDKIAFGMACYEGETKIVNMFLASQLFDVNEPIMNGLTPLLLATTNGSVKAAKMLLDAGANKYATNLLSQTGYDIAVYNNDSKMQALLTDKILSLPVTPLNSRTKHSPIPAIFLEKRIKGKTISKTKKNTNSCNNLTKIDLYEQYIDYFEGERDSNKCEDHSFCRCHYLKSILSPLAFHTRNKKQDFPADEVIFGTPKKSKLKNFCLKWGNTLKRTPRKTKLNERWADDNSPMEKNLRITQLLTTLHLEEYISVLIKHEFDVPTILDLDEQNLIEIGIDCEEKRKEILNKLGCFK